MCYESVGHHTCLSMINTVNKFMITNSSSKKTMTTTKISSNKFMACWLRRSLAYGIAVLLFLYARKSNTVCFQPTVNQASGLDDSSHRIGQEIAFVSEESSWLLLQKSIPTTTQTTGINELDWKNLLIKPLVYEVGGIIIFHFLGVPFVAHTQRFLQYTSRIQTLGTRSNTVVKGAMQAKVVWKATQRISSKSAGTSSTTSLLKQLQKTITKLFKKRSRLSVASEFGNFVGLEDDEDEEISSVIPATVASH